MSHSYLYGGSHPNNTLTHYKNIPITNIGTGTHGAIYSLYSLPEGGAPNTTAVAIKIYADETKYGCDWLTDEFQMHTLLHSANDYIAPIYVPAPSHFETLALNSSRQKLVSVDIGDTQSTDAQTYCAYQMEQIHPVIFNVSADVKQEKIIVVNLYEKSYHAEFSHGKNTISLGCDELVEYGLVPNLQEFVYNVGNMFSYLHFVMQVDGYDCELLLGSLQKKSDCATPFLIDYDKCNHIPYVECVAPEKRCAHLSNPLYQIVGFNKKDKQLFIPCVGSKGRRSFPSPLKNTVNIKVAEGKYDILNISTPQKMARYLFRAASSMSLVPSQPELYQEFLRGYGNHASTPFHSRLVHEFSEIVQEQYGPYE